MQQLIYGTAWKEDDTKRCVTAALAAGFRAIDTANQRKHYFEAAVGEAIAESGLPREDVWIQTKFTHRGGQDHRLPYDPKASIATQVKQSFESSLEHLRVTYIDSLVLHGPSQRTGRAPEDLEAWTAMEELHAGGRVRALGVSNVTRAQLALLVERAKVPVRAAQIRCYADRGAWDRDMRAFCRGHAIAYQGFSLLTANTRAVGKLGALAQRRGLTPEQLVFRFALDVGMTPLTGTTDPAHMAEDLATLKADALDAGAIAQIETITA